MKGKLAIVISETGIEAITIMSNGEETRTAGRSLCEFLESEISDFELAVKRKINDYEKSKTGTRQ